MYIKDLICDGEIFFTVHTPLINCTAQCYTTVKTCKTTTQSVIWTTCSRNRVHTYKTASMII
jgi:hypothetical protein